MSQKRCCEYKDKLFSRLRIEPYYLPTLLEIGLKLATTKTMTLNDVLKNYTFPLPSNLRSLNIDIHGFNLLSEFSHIFSGQKSKLN
jgi:hypothetical protein